MRRALALAASVRTRTAPNPWVGCVVVSPADAVATKGPPAPRRTPRRGGGARRPPATDARGRHPLQHARALRPPRSHPAVHRGHRRRRGGPGGGGRARPRPPGVGTGRRGAASGRASTVDVGVAADEAAELLAPYLKHRRTGRPWVVLKLAATLDGRIAAPDGTSRWLTGEEARADAHRLRATSDAVLVGAGDRARRRPRADRPRRSRSPSASPCGSCSARAPTGARVQPALEMSGEPGAVLDELGAQGVLQVLVEGGARVAHAFHRAGLVDRYVLYLAPALFGGDDAVPMFAGPGRPAWRTCGGAGWSR